MTPGCLFTHRDAAVSFPNNVFATSSPFKWEHSDSLCTVHSLELKFVFTDRETKVHTEKHTDRKANIQI